MIGLLKQLATNCHDLQVFQLSCYLALSIILTRLLDLQDSIFRHVPLLYVLPIVVRLAGFGDDSAFFAHEVTGGFVRLGISLYVLSLSGNLISNFIGQGKNKQSSTSTMQSPGDFHSRTLLRLATPGLNARYFCIGDRIPHEHRFSPHYVYFLRLLGRPDGLGRVCLCEKSH